ncbi:NIF family HAD-type phosphatase [Kordia sp.]|uniref:NIF family HAD-type phosphatase n=1 Tax=Kordia sp. TaxID=1965332 RepID=UPI003D6B225A
MNETEKILLILDLDETLIHATETKLEIDSDFQYAGYYVYKRPNLIEFLIEMNQYFKLAIWSSADDKYVNDVTELIKPTEIEFEFVWARSRCTIRRDYELDQYVPEKRLKKVKKRGFRLEKSLIVDDSPEKTKDNFGNAIYVLPFEGNQNDNELNILSEFLKTIKDSENVRRIEKRGWRNIKTANNNV